MTFSLQSPRRSGCFTCLSSSSTGHADWRIQHHSESQFRITLQQLREVMGNGGGYRYLIHDRDGIFSKHLDDSITALGVQVLRSPVASPKANSIAERVIGTIRRECLDWMIPLCESHLRAILRAWVTHYNMGRVHSRLGPGVPDPPPATVTPTKSESRHRLAANALVRSKSILSGLHHEYWLRTCS